MDWSGLLVRRVFSAVALVLIVSSVALAGPKDTTPPTHDPTPPSVELTSTGCFPNPAPEGEPDDYMDRAPAPRTAAFAWVARVAGLYWLSWLAR